MGRGNAPQQASLQAVDASISSDSVRTRSLPASRIQCTGRGHSWLQGPDGWQILHNTSDMPRIRPQVFSDLVGVFFHGVPFDHLAVGARKSSVVHGLRLEKGGDRLTLLSPMTLD